MSAHDEQAELRRGMRDLVALSSLTALWSGRSVDGIAEILADALHPMLVADFVYVFAYENGTGRVFRVGRARDEFGSDLAAISAWFPVHLTSLSELPEAIPHPMQDRGMVKVATAGFHLPMLQGFVAAGSARSGFPTDVERMLLSVGAGQMAAALERKHADDRRERSERELADFFDNATVGLHWVGSDGTILRANRAELDLLGYTAEEYVGQHIARFHVDQDAIDDILRRLQAGEEIHSYPARLRCKNGSTRHVLISSNVLWDNGSFVHTRCFTRDVSERRVAELRLERQTERLQLLSEVASLLLTSADVHQMLQHMFQKVGPHLGLDAYLNYVGSDSRNTLTLASYAGISQEAALAAARVEKGSGICGKVARTGSPSIENDVTGHEGLEWAAREGLRTYASYPLMSDGRLLGTVAFLSRTPGGLGDEDAAFLQTVTQYAAGACERLRLLEELREADARKNEFLATLAHELRNPLAPVRNAVQLLNLRGSPDPDCVTARGLIDRQIDHLIRLIDDLLDLSRITRNKVELRNEAVDVADLVRTAVEASLPAIKSAGHQLTVSMPDEPLPLMADPVRNAQVLTNLLNNAAKYTEPGGDIRLTAERDGDHVTIAVADNGIGIAEDKLPHVFEVFYQVDTSLERSRNGLGIGLSLVDRLVRLQGGTVEAFSDGPGKGSRFVVRLPLATDVTPALADVEDEHLKQEQRPERRRILIVDDNEDSAESLAMLLRVLGNEVWTAHDGLAGIEAVERNKPHVALIDLGMPKLNGYEACRRIREQPWGREIILMALTGWGQDKDRRRTRDAGFDAHLVKPVSTETLMTELTRCFEIQSQRFDAAVREARATAGS